MNKQLPLSMQHARRQGMSSLALCHICKVAVSTAQKKLNPHSRKTNNLFGPAQTKCRGSNVPIKLISLKSDFSDLPIK